MVNMCGFHHVCTISRLAHKQNFKLSMKYKQKCECKVQQLSSGVAVTLYSDKTINMFIVIGIHSVVITNCLFCFHV